MSATAVDAVVARLKGGATAAGQKVYPTTNTQGATLSFVVVTRQATAPASRLSGRAALLAVTVGVDCYAASQADADALAGQVRALLAPAGAPWVDRAAGVQGCFLQDGADEIVSDESKDTPRVARETFLVWHSPT